MNQRQKIAMQHKKVAEYKDAVKTELIEQFKPLFNDTKQQEKSTCLPKEEIYESIHEEYDEKLDNLKEEVEELNDIRHYLMLVMEYGKMDEITLLTLVRTKEKNIYEKTFSLLELSN